MNGTITEARRTELEDVRTLMSVAARVALAWADDGPRVEFVSCELGATTSRVTPRDARPGPVALALDPVPFVRGHADIESIELAGRLSADGAVDLESVIVVGAGGARRAIDPADLESVEPDPVAPGVVRAVTHLNDDHADALLVMAQAFGGLPNATAAGCAGADRLGLDLDVETPEGNLRRRIMYFEPIDRPGGLRVATVELAKRGREALS